MGTDTIYHVLLYFIFPTAKYYAKCKTDRTKFAWFEVWKLIDGTAAEWQTSAFKYFLVNYGVLFFLSEYCKFSSPGYKYWLSLTKL